MAKIIQTGCNPTRSPTNLGETILPSTNCPNKKTPMTIAIRFQSDQHQPDRVIAAEHRANTDLAAQETADRRINLEGEPAHGFALTYRHPTVDHLDHRMPVADEVEGH